MHPGPERTMERVGARVRRARALAGLRQDELAFAAGVSTRLVHAIEAGKPTVRVDGLVHVLGALGLTLEASSFDDGSAGASTARPTGST